MRAKMPGSAATVIAALAFPCVFIVQDKCMLISLPEFEALI